MLTGRQRRGLDAVLEAVFDAIALVYTRNKAIATKNSRT